MFALTDLTFVLFPILIIRTLNMPLQRRIGLCILMTGSIFSMVACIMRIVTAHQSNLYQTAMGMLWAGLEQCLVITLGSAATLPPLRRLELSFFPSFSTSLASLVGLMSHWRLGKTSSDGQDNSSERNSDNEKAQNNVITCRSLAPNDTVVEAATWSLLADDRNLYDSYECMPEQHEPGHSRGSAIAS